MGRWAGPQAAARSDKHKSAKGTFFMAPVYQLDEQKKTRLPHRVFGLRADVFRPPASIFGDRPIGAGESLEVMKQPLLSSLVVAIGCTLGCTAGGSVSLGDPAPITLLSVTSDVLEPTLTEHTWVVHPRLLNADATVPDGALEAWAERRGIVLTPEQGFVLGPAYPQVLETLEDCDAECDQGICTLPSSCHGYVVTRDASSDFQDHPVFIRSLAPDTRIAGEPRTRNPDTSPLDGTEHPFWCFETHPPPSGWGNR